MKYIKFFLFLLLFVPFMTFAEENISISSIEKYDIKGSTEEIADPIIENDTIKLNLKMYDLKDNITYKITISNNSEGDYYINTNDMIEEDSPYIDYDLSLVGSSNELKSKTSIDMLLKVTYNNEVDKSLLNANNTFDASNIIKFNISAQTVNSSTIADKIINPKTSDQSGIIASICVGIILLITIIVLIVNGNKIHKNIMVIISVLLIQTFLLVPIIYADISWSFNVDATIEIEYRPTLNETILGLSKKENACVTKYEGEITDKVGVTKTAENVYFDKCINQRNVIFAGFCWQVIRTTETGGTKLIYNGEVVDGKCENTRGEHIGIVGSEINYISDLEATAVDLSEEYLYGSTFTYDKTNKTFKLVDTSLATWSDSSYEDLLGKFTCMSKNDTCTKLYNVNSYGTNKIAFTSSYRIDNTNYAQIGTTPYNGSDRSPALAGYMFNKVYNYQWKFVNGGTYYKFADSVTYNDGYYTLSGKTYDIRSMASGLVKNYHYTCWNSTGECYNVAYVFQTSSTEAYYILLSNGKTITDVFNEMLLNDDINKYNSSIKAIIDAWYSQELSKYTNYLEDTVFCNSRDTLSIGGWDPNGGDTAKSRTIEFKNSNPFRKDLSCKNIIDQFSLSNNKAKLKYPVALIEAEEKYNLSPSTSLESPLLALVSTNFDWWTMAPYYFLNMGLYMSGVNDNGTPSVTATYAVKGARPVISLKTNSVILSGTGSEESPWKIK